MIRLEINDGLNLDLGTTPTRAVDITPASVAVLGDDYPGARLQPVVTEGDTVRRGDVLITDRAHPMLRLTAPAAGRVQAVRLGARRRLESLVIEVDAGHPDPTVLKGTPCSPADVREALLAAGLWPALRTRPHDRIPDPDATVAELYVVALDTNPLAPDPVPVIRANADAFREGLERLASLVERCYVCMASGAGLSCPESERILPVQVSGPHPAGLPGTLIYGITAARGGRAPTTEVWHASYQDVIAIGALFLSGRLDSGRTVTVAGPGMPEGRLVQTLMGAALTDLTGRPSVGSRVVSGPVLTGREVGRSAAFLGRYHQQVFVLDDSARDVAAERPDGSGMLALEAFERVWPLRLPVLPLLKAVLVGDTETVAALGATHLAPEDLALVAYLCPSRLDYGEALERTLDALRRGG